VAGRRATEASRTSVLARGPIILPAGPRSAMGHYGTDHPASSYGKTPPLPGAARLSRPLGPFSVEVGSDRLPMFQPAEKFGIGRLDGDQHLQAKPHRSPYGREKHAESYAHRRSFVGVLSLTPGSSPFVNSTPALPPRGPP
jgi:hypothetical protein